MAMSMNDMVRALANMPEEQRKTMMKERLGMFAEMSKADRKTAMSQMMEAVGSLPQGDIKKMLKSRTEVLCELPEDTRMALMGTHMDIMKGLPQQKVMMEMEIIKSIMPELSARHRQQVEEMMKMMPMPAMAGASQRAMPVTPPRTAAPTPRSSRAWVWWLVGAAVVAIIIIIIVANQ